MAKLILKTSKQHSLNDSENIDLGNLNFDLTQFKIPQTMVVQKEGSSNRVVKEKILLANLLKLESTMFFLKYMIVHL